MPYLKREQEKESLYWVEATINEISHEEIVSVRAVASHLE